MPVILLFPTLSAIRPIELPVKAMSGLYPTTGRRLIPDCVYLHPRDWSRLAAASRHTLLSRYLNPQPSPALVCATSRRPGRENRGVGVGYGGEERCEGKAGPWAGTAGGTLTLSGTKRREEDRPACDHPKASSDVTMRESCLRVYQVMRGHTRTNPASTSGLSKEVCVFS